MDRPIFVNARFVTQPLTGVQRYGYEIARRLPNVRLIAPPSCRPEYSGLVQSGSFTAARPSLGRGIGGHAWEQFVLPRRLPRDCVLWSPGGAGPLAVRNQVLTIHDLAHLEHPEWYSRSFAALYRWLLPRLARRVRLLLTISEHSRNRIVELLGIDPNRIQVIHPGVDERFCVWPVDRVRQSLQRLNVQGPYILAVSAISARKNISRMFEAWARICGVVGDLSLVVVGEAGLAFSGMSSAGALPPRTVHLGRIHDDDLVALYNGATAFVYPSLYEGFGLPPLEAMACDCPVVCSNNTSLPEAVGDAALLVDPFDTDSIANGIRRIIGDSALRDSLRLAGQHRAARFSWDRTAEAVHQLLRQAATD